MVKLSAIWFLYLVFFLSLGWSNDRIRSHIRERTPKLSCGWCKESYGFHESSIKSPDSEWTACASCNAEMHYSCLNEYEACFSCKANPDFIKSRVPRLLLEGLEIKNPDHRIQAALEVLNIDRNNQKALQAIDQTFISHSLKPATLGLVIEWYKHDFGIHPDSEQKLIEYALEGNERALELILLGKVKIQNLKQEFQKLWDASSDESKFHLVQKFPKLINEDQHFFLIKTFKKLRWNQRYSVSKGLYDFLKSKSLSKKAKDEWIVLLVEMCLIPHPYFDPARTIREEDALNKFRTNLLESALILLEPTSFNWLPLILKIIRDNYFESENFRSSKHTFLRQLDSWAKENELFRKLVESISNNGQPSLEGLKLALELTESLDLTLSSRIKILENFIFESKPVGSYVGDRLKQVNPNELTEKEILKFIERHLASTPELTLNILAKLDEPSFEVRSKVLSGLAESSTYSADKHPELKESLFNFLRKGKNRRIAEVYLELKSLLASSNFEVKFTAAQMMLEIDPHHKPISDTWLSKASHECPKLVCKFLVENHVLYEGVLEAVLEEHIQREHDYPAWLIAKSLVELRPQEGLRIELMLFKNFSWTSIIHGPLRIFFLEYPIQSEDGQMQLINFSFRYDFLDPDKYPLTHVDRQDAGTAVAILRKAKLTARAQKQLALKLRGTWSTAKYQTAAYILRDNPTKLTAETIEILKRIIRNPLLGKRHTLAREILEKDKQKADCGAHLKALKTNG